MIMVVMMMEVVMMDDFDNPDSLNTPANLEVVLVYNLYIWLSQVSSKPRR